MAQSPPEKNGQYMYACSCYGFRTLLLLWLCQVLLQLCAWLVFRKCTSKWDVLLPCVTYDSLYVSHSVNKSFIIHVGRVFISIQLCFITVHEVHCREKDWKWIWCNERILRTFINWYLDSWILWTSYISPQVRVSSELIKIKEFKKSWRAWKSGNLAKACSLECNCTAIAVIWLKLFKVFGRAFNHNDFH